MWLVWCTEVVYRGFWWRNLKEIILWESQSIDGRKIFKWITKKRDWAWIEFFWLRIGSRGELL